MAMVVGNFSGADADELRRAVGMRRSWERMTNLEAKFSAEMSEHGIDAKTQNVIWQQISLFALYGFPESHAASFALLAYASAYIKVKFPEAFTCALLNNQPMGFYSPAVVVKDAQRHGVHIKPFDVQSSDWACTIEVEDDGRLSFRLGLGCAKSLRKRAGEAMSEARDAAGAFRSIEDLVARVPLVNHKELELLAQIGALNSLDGMEHRRDALWQAKRAGKLEGPLLSQAAEAAPLQTETANPGSGSWRMVFCVRSGRAHPKCATSVHS